MIAGGGKEPRGDRDPADVGLAFSDVTYGGGRRAWLVDGEPGQPVVVIVHGFGGDRAGTLDLGPLLRQRGYALLFIELGYLSSGRYGGGQREADDVSYAVDWASSRLSRPVVLLGFSGGGYASLAAVARGAPVAAVVSDSAFVGFRQVVAFRAHVDPVFTNLLPVLYPLVSGGGHLVDIARRIGDRPFAAPTLVIQGAADTTVPPGSGRRLAELTGGQLWQLPGVGHTKAFDADRVEYLDRVDRFIRRVVPRPGEAGTVRANAPGG
ncbi:MAG: hypothetical protein ABIW46_03420 [Acidimicrobiales bacterium]